MLIFLQGTSPLKRRALYWVILFTLLLVAGFLPPDIPIWYSLAAGVIGYGFALFLFLDYLLGRWIRGQAGKQVNLVHFFVAQMGMIFGFLGISLGVLALFLIWRLGEGDRVLTLATIMGTIAGAFLLLAFLIPVLRKPSKDNRLAELRRKLPIKPLKEQFQNAWDFQRICGWRLLPTLAMLWLASLFFLVLLLGICTGIGTLAWTMASGGIELTNPDQWPFLLKLAVFLAILVTSCTLASCTLATFRIVHATRRTGRFRVKHMWRETGIALETVGILGTFAWGTAMTLSLIGVVAASFLLYHAVAEIWRLGHLVALPLSVLFGVLLAWGLLLFPQLYVMPVLVRRDCGWLRAIELSVDLVWLERGEALLKAVAATGLVLTIAGIPAAVCLLVVSLDNHDLLLSAVLGEKTQREIEEDIAREDSSRPERLQKYYNFIEKGRYLDGLNGFQMYLRTNRQNVDAWRGQSIALLHMGNLQARESLEMWSRLADDSTEADALLDELARGLWSEEGVKFKEAQKRCTQHIGQGVTGLGGG